MREPIHRYRLTDYDTSILPSRFLALAEADVRDQQDWIPKSGLSIGHPGWGLVYHLVLARLDPDGRSLVVETGTNIGSTATVIATAIRDSGREALLRTIEIDPETLVRARDRVNLAGVADFVEFFEGDSLSMLSTVLADEVDVPLVFLDGNHWHDHVVREFELVEPHLARDAIVVFDNTYLIAENDEDPRVNGALRTILDRFGGNLVNLPFCSWYTPGISIWQRQPFEDMSAPAPGSFRPET